MLFFKGRIIKHKRTVDGNLYNRYQAVNAWELSPLLISVFFFLICLPSVEEEVCMCVRVCAFTGTVCGPTQTHTFSSRSQTVCGIMFLF